MREWSHDQLHRIIDSTANIKKLSDKIHTSPQAIIWEEAIRQKQQMMGVYALATNCQRATLGKRAVEEVFCYLQQQYESYRTYRDKPGTNPEHLKAIQGILEKYMEQQLCHSPLGNNYVCFCKSLVKN